MKKGTNTSYDSDIKELLDQIQKMVANKKRKSSGYLFPENISKKAKNALLDMEQNHDNSYAVEMFLNSQKHLNKTNIFYRGRKFSGYEFWSTVTKYAKALRALGIEKGDEVPVMMSNCPEYFFLLIALDLIGAIMNIVGPWFDKNYLKEIFIGTKCQYIFVTDDINEATVYGIENADNLERVFIFSLTDSLPKDEKGLPYNPFAEYDDKFGHFINKVEMLKATLTKPVKTTTDFLSFSDNYSGDYVADMVLSDPCIITYTSGTTSPGRPKACLHNNRNYLSISRFKKADVAPMPPVKNLTALAHLPSYTQTVLTSAYADPLFMGWTTALEPYYELEFYPYSLLINKPHHTVETPEYEKYVAKLLDTTWKDVKMRERGIVIIGGQELSPGLERYLNKIAKEHGYGTSMLPFPLSPSTISVAGGTSENGGYLTTLFRSFMQKEPRHFITKSPMLMKSIGLADMEVLTPDGMRCKNYQRGICVVNTPTNQIGYVNDEFNKNTELTDNFGKKWRTTGTPGYKDRFGCIRYVDRPNTDIVLSDGETIPIYTILDLIKTDTKNIMEAYLAKIAATDHVKYVIHIEKQPDAAKSNATVLKEIAYKLEKEVHKEVLDNLFFRFRSFSEGFPVAGTGKTDINALEKEGLTEKCIAFDDINNTVIQLSSLEKDNLPSASGNE